MPVLAVINRKGGSGKSTLATHLAAHCASVGLSVMLGDVDKQQSSLGWLKRRAANPRASDNPITGWAADTRSVLRPPAGVTHVVLDTPGGLRGFDLARVAMQADAIFVPVCDSAFDREAAAEGCAELMALPRVASGRCKVGLVGMRLDARTNAPQQLAAWAKRHRLDYVGSLRAAQAYVLSGERGLTLFDLPSAKVGADLAQWQPIIEWVQAALAASERADKVAKSSVKPNSRPIDRPAQVPAVTLGHDLSPAAMRALMVPQAKQARSIGQRMTDRFDWLMATLRPSA